MTGAGTEEHPAACSTQVALTFGVGTRATEIRKHLDTFLFDLTDFLRDNGCTLIGHIKGLLDAGDSGQLFFSITSFTDGIRYKGNIAREIAEANLSLNTIVYGIRQASVENAIQERLKRLCAETGKR